MSFKSLFAFCCGLMVAPFLLPIIVFILDHHFHDTVESILDFWTKYLSFVLNTLN